MSPSGSQLFRSPTLEKLWKFGFSDIGDVTMKSAAYVARYCMKKIKEVDAQFSDRGFRFTPFERRSPEFTVMSRRPGIGTDWYNKYFKEIYTEDSLVLDGGVEVKAPQFYDRKFALTHPVEFDSFKAMRKEKAESSVDNTPERLAVREEVCLSRVDLLRRDY